MANIETIKAKLKAWQKNDGEVRYYVNDWQRIIGLEVDYYKTGNVADVSYEGNHWSNCFYKKYVAGTKVWFDANAEVHVDYCKEDWLVEDIKRKISEAFA